MDKNILLARQRRLRLIASHDTSTLIAIKVLHLAHTIIG
jgi:hypothetical protein